MEWEGVQPVCNYLIEENSKHNLREGFGNFDEDEFLVNKEGMGGGVSGQVMIDALGCQCGGGVQVVDECGGSCGDISLDGN